MSIWDEEGVERKLRKVKTGLQILLKDYNGHDRWYWIGTKRVRKRKGDIKIGVYLGTHQIPKGSVVLPAPKAGELRHRTFPLDEIVKVRKR